MEYESDFSDEFIETSHGKIHIMHHSGNSEKLVFLHGVGASTRTWRKIVPYLSSDYDIYLVDLLGHGKSDDPNINYDIGLQVSVVGEAIEKMGISRPFLVGHSYGAWTAVFLALGMQAKGIVIIDPAGVKEHFEEIVNSGEEEKYKADMLGLLMKLGNREHVMRSILESDFNREYLSKDVLSRLKIPALIVWGREDNMVPSKFAQVVAGSISKSVLKIIDGAGHDPHYTKPEEVASYLNAFVSSVG